MQDLADHTERVSEAYGGYDRGEIVEAVLLKAYECEDFEVVSVPGDCKLREWSECKSLVTEKNRSCPPEIEL